jgi:hypothetical protein
MADLNDVIPLISLLQTGSESEKETALQALAGLAIDHQQVPAPRQPANHSFHLFVTHSLIFHPILSRFPAIFQLFPREPLPTHFPAIFQPFLAI